MSALICDICGGKLLVGTGGIAQCDSCQTEHTKERVREKAMEIRGTVKIDGAITVEGVDSADVMYTRVLDFLKLNDYFLAEKTLHEMTMKHPGDSRGWQKLSLVLLDAQINSYSIYNSNAKLNPTNLNRIIQNAESFGDTAFLEELNAKRQIVNAKQNQKEKSESQEIIRRIFANGGCPSKEQFDKALSFGDAVFNTETMKNMAEYGAKQKETEALTQYLLNRMHKMFYGFGIDENTLNTYYANKNIRTYDKSGKERRQAEKLYNDARYCAHIMKYCSVLLNRFWNISKSERPLYPGHDSIAYWVRTQPVTPQIIDDVFNMIENTKNRNQCPYCGGSRNPLNWLTDKYSTCMKCKKGYTWDYKHYTTVRRPY